MNSYRILLWCRWASLRQFPYTNSSTTFNLFQQHFYHITLLKYKSLSSVCLSVPTMVKSKRFTHLSRMRVACRTHGVPRPKSQLASPKKSLKYGSLSSKLHLDYFMQKYSRDLCWELGLAFRSTTHTPSRASEKCCHVGIHVIVGT